MLIHWAGWEEQAGFAHHTPQSRFPGLLFRHSQEAVYNTGLEIALRSDPTSALIAGPVIWGRGLDLTNLRLLSWGLWPQMVLRVK